MSTSFAAAANRKKDGESTIDAKLSELEQQLNEAQKIAFDSQVTCTIVRCLITRITKVSGGKSLRRDRSTDKTAVSPTLHSVFSQASVV